ncbi:MAG: hypothetical protein ACLP52_15915 [Streptosporangiaceae bacterium]
MAAAGTAAGVGAADGADRGGGGLGASAGGLARIRVAVDGLTGAGKTSFGHELAAVLRSLGRATMRASMDDFKYLT